MRVTEDMTYRMLGSSISNTKQSVFDLQQQISSGRRVTNPSDDPGSFEMISRLRDDLSNVQQYTTNANRAQKDLQTVDNSLQGMVGIFQRVQEITVKGGDATISSADRTALSKEVDGLLKQLIDLANTSEGGRYTFAGLRSDTQPYTGTDTNADGMTDTVTYNGSAETRKIEISNGVYVDGNVVGSDPTGPNAVFQTNTVDLFQTLMNLRTNLAAGNNTSQTTDMDSTTKGLDHILTMLSTVGAREEQVRISQELLGQRETNIQSSLEHEEALDIAQAVTQLSQRQLAYEAALRSTSMVLNQKTLIDML